MSTALAHYIRWGLKRDAPAATDIACRCRSSLIKSEEDYIQAFRSPNQIVAVLEKSGLVVAYIVYNMPGCADTDQVIELVDLCVHPAARRQGCGRALLARIEGKLSERRPFATALVPETNTDLCLFLRACGWRACLSRDAFEDQDGYRFGKAWTATT